MPEKRFARLIILYEDLQHSCFVRRYLVTKGVRCGNIWVVTTPLGRGAGDAFVRDTYPAEVRSLRTKSYVCHGLIVMIDADNHSVSDREKELAKSLTPAGEEPRKTGDRVALLIPKRSIETWVHFLMNDLDEPVNENKPYPKLAHEKDCYPAADEFAARCPDREDDLLPSLRTACQELVHLAAFLQ
jgi:hypothetical protein